MWVENLTVNNIKLPINASFEEAFSVARERLRRLKVDLTGAEFNISKKSVDARDKKDIKFVYSIAVRVAGQTVDEKRLSENGASPLVISSPTVTYGNEPLSDRPVIVGSGPAGLFSALILAENGYLPVLIERGGSVSERKEAVERLRTFGILDPDTNIQFGAGGAGTFSDGKLITRVNDPLCSYVMDKLVEFGAPEDIRYMAKPHVGTDILSVVVDRVIDRIISLGGTVLFHTKLLKIEKDVSGKVVSVLTNNGKIPAGALILAVGHSARDTYEYLIDNGFSIEAKPFSVGMRIEHLTEDIDKAMYGDFAGDERLGHAEYALSHNTKERGVYTFCMCPGGEVVCAASESEGLVVNGMSERARDGANSNSAVVCSIFKEDFGATPRAAIEYQRRIERAAFVSGGGNFSAPYITVGDLLDGKVKNEFSRVKPSYRDASVRLASPDEYLPSFVVQGIKGAILSFDKRINGFASKTAVLTGAETRTSAPIRILRDRETNLALGSMNIYPAGEGAGYAGGITSAAIDGIKCACALMRAYRPLI